MYTCVVLPHFWVLTVLIFLLYAKIAQTACRQSRQVKSEGHSNSETGDKKITKMMAMVLGVYFILNVPTNLCGIFGFQTLTLIFVLMFDINVWINPVIYYLKNKDFRKAYRITLKYK